MVRVSAVTLIVSFRVSIQEQPKPVPVHRHPVPAGILFLRGGIAAHGEGGLDEGVVGPDVNVERDALDEERRRGVVLEVDGFGLGFAHPGRLAVAMSVRNALQELLVLAGLKESPARKSRSPAAIRCFPRPISSAPQAPRCWARWAWRYRRPLVSEEPEDSRAYRSDVRAAAAAMRSARYLKIDGKAPKETLGSAERLLPGEGRPLGQHPLQFRQPSRSGDESAGQSGGPRRRGAASRGWDGLALEDAIHAAKGCAGLARTRGGMGAASAFGGRGGAAAAGNSKDW